MALSAIRMMAVTFSATLAAHAADGSQHLGPQWSIQPGANPLEQTAAEDLRDALAERHGLTLAIEPAAADSAGPRILVGTVADHPGIAAEHARKPFTLTDDPESYHLATRGDDLYIVGAGGKGAMNGVFRFLERQSVDVTGLDQAESPAFRFRVGGHKMNQHPPDDWSELDQARYYASHYLNVVWGEKQGPPMSHAARKKYGLGLMVEVRFPPVSNQWMDDPANADAVFYLKPGQQRRVVSPFSPKGREAYLAAYRKLLAEQPDVKILYAVFADYNATPSDESVNVSTSQPHAKSRAETMKEILRIMDEATGRRADILKAAWLWHGFFGQDEAEARFMEEVAAMGYGAFYNEAGNADDWIFKRDNFNATAVRTGPDGKTAYGPNYLPLVSAGGACESINPVIGFPLPWVAGHKIHRLAELDVKNFALWWAAAEGWVYQPNVEVVAQMIWDPSAFGADADALVRRIAERDFGPELAPQVIDFYRAFDAALVTDVPLYAGVDEMPAPDTNGLHIHDWYQRMGIFTERIFGGPYPLPLTPDALGSRKELQRDRYWGFDPRTHRNYEIVLDRLGRAIDRIQALHERGVSGDVGKRLSDLYHWSSLYRHLLTSQYHYLRALTVLRETPRDAWDSDAIRDRLRPIIEAEIANGEALISLLPGLPANANIRMNMEGTVNNEGSVEDEIAVLRQKIGGMRLWLAPRVNLAEGANATASSVESDDLAARFATDGDAATRWSSKYSDGQWLTVDLGEHADLGTLTIDWNPAYAKAYAVQVADRADGPWRSVYRTTAGRGGYEIIELPAGTSGRFIRLDLQQRGTGWGFSINELSAFAPHAADSDDALQSVAAEHRE